MQGEAAYQEGVEEESALLRSAGYLRRAAGDATARGEEMVGRVERERDTIIGSQRVAAGASGVRGASVEAIEANTQALSARDIETIRLNASREAWGFSVEADEATTRARRSRQRGENQRFGSFLGSIGNAAGSAAGYLGTGYSMVRR